MIWSEELMNELISIIVPIYKVEKYLNGCIESILNQTYKNLEIILVDDGSPDRCAEICDEWALKDKRIHVIHKSNGGLSDARNVGLSFANGKYIAFIDSDDTVSIHFIEILYKILYETNSDIVQCDYKKMDSQYIIDESFDVKHEVIQFNRHDALMALINERPLNQVVWNKLYKRELFENIKFDIGKLNEDDYFTYRIFSKCERVSYVNIKLYYYLVRKTSIMGNDYSLKRLDGLYARIQCYEYLKNIYLDIAIVDKKNVLFYLLYCYQKILTIDDKSERNEGKKILKRIYKRIKKDSIKMNLLVKEKIWFLLMNISLNWTAKLRNYLRINVE